MERQQPNKRSRADKGIGRMILLSLVVHVGAIAAVVMAGGQRPLEPVAPKAYTVSLIDPTALGGGLPPGPGKDVGQQSKVLAKAPDKPAPSAAPKPPNPPPVEDKPVETVKQSPPVPPKPEPKKGLVKLPTKEKQKKEKKPKPKKTEKKEKPKPQAEKKTVKQKKKIEKKQEKKVASKQPESPLKKPKPKKDTPVKKPTPKKIAKKAKDSVSAQKRDEQRLSAAIERIRKNVESNTRQSGQAGATQHGRGGSGSGGGGGVQGLAFMMYTEQVKQRVKESWIVTQKKSGLTAVVQFGVRPSGDIVDVELAQSSGNNAFDQSVLRAIHHANPLPPPPQEYQQEFLNQKVKVAFGK